MMIILLVDSLRLDCRSIMKLKINLELLIFVFHNINLWIILKFRKLERNIVICLREAWSSAFQVSEYI
jgi:hypothetical protein